MVRVCSLISAFGFAHMQKQFVCECFYRTRFISVFTVEKNPSAKVIAICALKYPDIRVPRGSK